MIIYTDSNSEFIGTNLTPAHTYAATTDFINHHCSGEEGQTYENK